MNLWDPGWQLFWSLFEGFLAESPPIAPNSHPTDQGLRQCVFISVDLWMFRVCVVLFF